MFPEALIFGIALAVLIVGSYTDFRTREVPDWLNYGLIFFALGLRVILTLVYGDLSFLLYGAFGFFVFFCLALLMFYTGQWGGGDSKMIMGLGALIGLPLALDAFLLSFLLNMIIFGSLYGIVYAIFIAIRNWHLFTKEFGKIYQSKAKEKYLVWGVSVFLLVVMLLMPSFTRILVFALSFLVFISFYLYLSLKSVESACMVKWIEPSLLTEGDWVIKDVNVAGKRICGPKDLGVEKKQIEKLVKFHAQGKVKKVLVKYGIPFVPSFLLAFIASHLWGNVMFIMLNIS